MRAGLGDREPGVPAWSLEELQRSKHMEILSEFEFTAPAGHSEYDWETLMDGSIRKLNEGTDFTCKLATFATLARKAALKRKLTLRTSKVDGGIVIQAIPMTAEEKARLAEKEKAAAVEEADEKSPGDATPE